VLLIELNCLQNSPANWNLNRGEDNSCPHATEHTPEYCNGYAKGYEIKLNSQVKVKANEKDIHIKTEIISSKDIAGGMLDFAEENNIDLIVIGTRGRSGFKRLLVGSVASHVVAYAHCPVLVVK
jgi:nucleotide-binding universal stress UspA family protein